MFSVNNGLNLLIGKSIARTASVQVTDRTAATFIADGEIVVLKSDGTAITAGDTITDTEWIQLVQRSGATASTAQLVYSPRIFGQWITAYRGKDGVAAVEQVTNLGYNGTSGAIDTTAESRLLNITYTMDEQNWSEQLEQRWYQHVGTTPTQAEIAESIARQANNDLATKVKSEILLDDAGAAIVGTAANVAVTNGSVTIVFDGTHDLVAGDYVRLNGTTTATPTYKVSSVSGVTVTLSMPYQGTSGSIAIASVERITAVLAAAAAAGIKFTGLPLTFSKGFFKYLKTSFVINLPTDDWGTTDLAYTTTASRGTGVYEQIAELEWFALGEDGALNRTLVPLPEGRADATSGSLYDVITIHFYDASDVYAVSGTKPSERLVYLAVVDGAAQGTSLINELNPWMASTPRAFDNISL